MFDNISNKIKVAAKVFTWLGILVSFFLGIKLFSLGQRMVFYGFIVMLVGSLLAWVCSFALYGFGHLIENTDKLVKNNSLNKNNNITYKSVDTSTAKIENKNTESDFKKQDDKWMMCPKCNNRMDLNVGHCVFCGFAIAKDDTVDEKEQESKNYSIGKCDICKREAVVVRDMELDDELGKCHKNVCENCMKDLTELSQENKQDYSNEYTPISKATKRAFIGIAMGIAVLIIIILIATNSKVCVNCGDKIVGEAYQAFGDYWCEECFFS